MKLNRFGASKFPKMGKILIKENDEKYIIIKLPNDNWGMVNLDNGELIGCSEYYLIDLIEDRYTRYYNNEDIELKILV